MANREGSKFVDANELFKRDSEESSIFLDKRTPGSPSEKDRSKWRSYPVHQLKGYPVKGYPAPHGKKV